MIASRIIDAELSNAFGRNSILRTTAQDNENFILCHPELADKLDRWQTEYEELFLEMNDLKQTVRDRYLEGIEYDEYLVVPSSCMLRITTARDISKELSSDWRIIET